jgi:hypothetical protein
MGSQHDDQAWPRPSRLAYTALTVVTVAVIVLAGVRTASGDFYATSDTGMEIITTRGVFSDHPPLLGSHSSADPESGIDYHHPGPLLFYLASPFVALLGERGMPLACALVNAGAVLVVALLARRWSRPMVATAVLASFSVLVWTMGSGLLTSLWNPHVAMLPFGAGVVATWAVWQGSRGGVVWGVLMLSLAAQVHLPYLPLALLVLGFLAVAVGWQVAGARRGADASAVRRWVAVSCVAAAAGLVSALAPLLQQLANGSDGNLARIVRGGGFSDPTGLGAAASFVATRLAVEPWFLRSGWANVVYHPQVAGTAALAVGGLVAAVAVGATVVRSARQRDAQVVVLASMPASLLLAGTLMAARFPLRFDGTPAANFYWAWPLSALVWAAVVGSVMEMAAGRRSALAYALPAGVAAAAAVLVLSASIPYEALVVDNKEYWQQRSADLIAQARPYLDGIDEVQVVSDFNQGQFLMAPALFNRLLDEGVRAASANEDMVQQLGESFRSDRTEPWVLVFTGPETATPPTPAAERIALVQPNSDEAAARLAEQVVLVAEELGPEGIVAASGISERERREVVEPVLDAYRADPAGTLLSGGMVIPLDFGLVEVRGAAPERSEDVIRRHGRQRLEATALWLVPRSEWAAIGG